MASVVFVEDDLEIRNLVARVLAGHGHDVVSAATAMEGLEAAVKGAPDLVILDLGLPDLDGFELLKMIRAVSAVPVIVATARGVEDEIIRTLDAGADDYLVKPFGARQLEARVRAVLRRRSEDAEPVTIVGGLDHRSSVPAGCGSMTSELELTPKEFDLLLFLAERAGEVVTKREILAEVWREPYGGADRTIDVHLSWLRKKLGESAAEPRYLRTVHGVGIKLVDPGG